MIYAYMQNQMNSEPITTSYYTLLKLVVIIYFAIIIIPRPNAHWTAFVQAEQKCWQIVFCALI